MAADVCSVPVIVYHASHMLKSAVLLPGCLQTSVLLARYYIGTFKLVYGVGDAPAWE